VWTTISVRREVRERIEAFMREKGFVSPSDVIAFLFEHYDSRIRLEEKVRELEDRLSFVEKCMEDLLFTKATAPRAQAQPPQPQPQPSAPQAQLPQPPIQPPQQPQQPEPKLIPASELPEARKALEEAERVEARTELRPFVIFWSPKDLEKAKRWLEANGRPVTGEVEVLRKGRLVKVVFGTTPEVVDRYCEKLTELKVPTGALDDKAERDRLDSMFAEEPFAEFGTRAYLLNRAGIIYRDRDGTWRKA